MLPVVSDDICTTLYDEHQVNSVCVLLSKWLCDDRRDEANQSLFVSFGARLKRVWKSPTLVRDWVRKLKTPLKNGRVRLLIPALE